MAAPIPPPGTPPPATPPPTGVTVPVGPIPVWMDVKTAQFLITALTAALQGANQPKKK